MKMLAMRVEYLMGRAYAASHVDRDRSEWPPHPDRLFSALVSAAEEGVGTNEARAALRWLEAQPPPKIHASECSERTVVTSYVPVNDDPKPVPVRNRQPRTFPSVTPKDPVVWFAWPETDGAEHRPVLASVAREVVRMGHSASFVRVTVEDEVPIELRWLVPSNAGDRILRVARQGRYDTLDTLFAAGRRPTPAPSILYGTERPPQIKHPRGPYRDLVVFSLRATERGAPPDIRSTLALAEAVRGALLARLDGQAPAAVHGHTDDPHIAILPLPAVGHRHADGRIHGVAIAVPDLPEQERAEVFAALCALEDAEVWTRSGRWVLATGSSDVKTLDPGTWMGNSRWFSTVTPVIFDRFPRRTLTEDEVVAWSLTKRGYPNPARLRVDGHSAIPGCAPAWTIPARREGQPPRIARHVTVEFDEPVCGPMVLGALRHFGLGLFRPISERLGTAFLDDDVFPKSEDTE